MSPVTAVHPAPTGPTTAVPGWIHPHLTWRMKRMMMMRRTMMMLIRAGLELLNRMDSEFELLNLELGSYADMLTLSSCWNSIWWSCCEDSLKSFPIILQLSLLSSVAYEQISSIDRLCAAASAGGCNLRATFEETPTGRVTQGLLTLFAETEFSTLFCFDLFS